MPYRIDLHRPDPDAFDRLADLGAIDVELTDDGIAALMPDDVTVAILAVALGVTDIRVTEARGRDDGSVWMLTPRPLQIGPLRIVPAGDPAGDGALRLIDGPAFGTGFHPTTMLCLEAMVDELASGCPNRLLDIGAGSGILALAAIRLGVSGAAAIDIDPGAVRIARENAALNGLSARLRLVQGGPDALSGAWPLVVANVLTAPLIDMAPAVVQRVERRGRLVMSGIRTSLVDDVDRAYRHLGMRRICARARNGWTALTYQASW